MAPSFFGPQRVLLVMLAASFLQGCAPISPTSEWSPRRAVADAEQDIAAGNIKFAYVGGRAPLAPGLPDDSWRIIQRYPHLPVGPQGCTQDSFSEARYEYARRYNVRTWRYLHDETPARAPGR